MLDEILELLSVPGVSGFEGPVRESIKARAQWYAETSVDRMGNLHAEVGGGSPHIMLIAHMDENGFVITRIEDSGFLRFRTIGGWDDRCLVGRVVNVLSSKGTVKGVIGLLPPHLMTKPTEEMAKVLRSEDLHIDIGCTSAKEAQDLGIEAGTPVAPEKHPAMMVNEMISARGLDDRVGCAVLLEVLKRLHGKMVGSRVHYVWSVQEEIGLRGAQMLSMAHRPDAALVVDTCSASDVPGVASHFSHIRLGGGPVIRFIDNRAIATPGLVAFVRKVAEERGITVQMGISGGSTDGAMAQAGGAAMVPLGFPIRYTHSPVECVSMKDVEEMVRLLEALILDMDQGGWDAEKV
ncbi:MAG TPA: M20/M25/M40 family metallo-hydrolase [Methanomassiliicoccales archaeon]|nr:M20/M25/M40 family metallo-hydrolase [Methanomassiliicoccales archaeon]